MENDDGKNGNSVDTQMYMGFEGIVQPENCRIKLFPHQLVAVKMMENLEMDKKIIKGNSRLKTTFGIQGDITGYGKTLSMVTLIMRDKMTDAKKTTFHNDWVLSKFFTYKESTKTIEICDCDTTLIICPPEIINQWVETFDEFDDSDFLTITKPKELAEVNDTTKNDHKVIIISTKLLHKFLDKISPTIWKRVIYDEPDSNPIPNMRTIDCGFLWLISATWEKLPTIYAWRKNSFVGGLIRGASSILSKFVIKNDDSFVRQSYEMAIPKINHYRCQKSVAVDAVGIFVNPRIREMLVAGNIGEAIVELGGNDSKQNIMEVVLQRYINKIEKYKQRIQSTQSNAVKTIMENKLEKAQNIIISLKSRIIDALKTECPITGEKLEKPVLVPCCQNIFSGNALIKWLDSNHTCPMCRRELEPFQLIPVYDGEEFTPCDKTSIKRENELKPKQKVLCDIIKGNPDGRFLIFSNHDQSFSVIRRELEAESIKFAEISGSSTVRIKRIKEYKENKKNVLFLNSRFSGAGINLENTTDIILFHTLDERTYTQVIGRALRIGSTSQINIHQLDD